MIFSQHGINSLPRRIPAKLLFFTCFDNYDYSLGVDTPKVGTSYSFVQTSSENIVQSGSITYNGYTYAALDVNHTNYNDYSKSTVILSTPATDCISAEIIVVPKVNAERSFNFGFEPFVDFPALSVESSSGNMSYSQKGTYIGLSSEYEEITILSNTAYRYITDGIYNTINSDNVSYDRAVHIAQVYQRSSGYRYIYFDGILSARCKKINNIGGQIKMRLRAQRPNHRGLATSFAIWGGNRAAPDFSTYPLPSAPYIP